MAGSKVSPFFLLTSDKDYERARVPPFVASALRVQLDRFAAADAVRAVSAMNIAKQATSSSGLSSQQAFQSSSGQPMHSMILESRHLDRSRVWLPEFRELGVRGGVEKLLNLLFSENVKLGAGGVAGPTVSTDYFSQKVLIPLLVMYTGLVLTGKQKGTLQALLNLMSVPHRPVVAPMKGAEFMLRFKNCNQTTAIKGHMSTKVGGVTTSWQDILVTLDRYVTGFTIGDKELFLENNPNEVIAVLSEKLQVLETTWQLTVMELHAAYASRQPTLPQLMLMGRHVHQPDSPLARLLQLFFVDHLLCGALNRTQANFHDILLAISEFVSAGRAGEDFLAVVPQRVMDNGIGGKLTRRAVSYQSTGYVYSTVRPVGLDSYGLFGQVNSESSQSGVVEVESQNLSNGQVVYVIPIEGGTSVDYKSCDAPLVNVDGLKRLYFTVGACPDGYGHYCNAGYFGSAVGGAADSSASISPKGVAEHGPGTTYYMDYNSGQIAKVTLRDLHAAVNSVKLWDQQFCATAWRKVFGVDHLGYVNETMTAELLLESRQRRQQSPLMAFETDPRHMWVRADVNLQGARAPPVRFTLQGGDEFVYLLPRAVLGNASPCSNFENDIVGCVGSLAHVVKNITSNLNDLMEYTAIELERVDVAAVRNFRNNNVPNSSAVDRLNWLELIVTGHGILSDPINQVKFLQLFDAVTDPAAAAAPAAAPSPPAAGSPAASPTQQGAPPAAGDDDAAVGRLAEYVAANRVFLFKTYELITRGYADAMSLIKTVYADVSYNVLLAANRAVVGEGDIPPKYVLYAKFMYGMVLPALTDQMCYATNAIVASRVGNVMQGVMTVFNLGRSPTAVFVSKSATAPPGHLMISPYGSPADTLSLYRPLFRQRYAMLHNKFSGQNMVKMLALVHWWTAYNRTTLTKHMDALYYSGIAYTVVRHMRFRGHTMTALAQKSARFIIGNKAAAYPLTTWQATEYKQTVDMGMAPTDLGAVGLCCHNVFVDEIVGLGSSFDFKKSKWASLVFDAYNEHLPEAMNGFQPEMGMMSVHGRYSSAPLNEVCSVSGKYAQSPCSFMKTSVVFAATKDELNNRFSKDSSVGLMDTALQVPDFMASVPLHLQAVAENGINRVDVLNQLVGKARSAQSIFNPQFGGMFTDDYCIGFGSSRLLRDKYAPGVNDELTPRISSLGGINANAVFGQTDRDSRFMNAFQKQLTVAKLTMRRSF
nr:mcp [Herpesvirus DDDp]